MEWSQGLDFDKIDVNTFFAEYCWAVLCSGMKVTVARLMQERLFRGGFHPERIGHPLKRRALEEAWQKYPEWFAHLRSLRGRPEEQVEYLDSLPHIGPITKLHLAQNIGLEVAKPDVHLQRVAKRFGYESVQEMCEVIAAVTGERVRTVDLVIWRRCEQKGSRNLETPNLEGQSAFC
jgi:hypothetical protein